MQNKLTITTAPELATVETSKAKQIQDTFEPMVALVGSFEERFNEIVSDADQDITPDVVNRAKRVRLDIAKVRIQTEKIRVAQKEEFVRGGKAVDGVANILKWAVTEKENKLKEIETHFERQEQIRIELLETKRVDLLTPFLEFGSAFPSNLAGMTDDVWDAYLSTKKKGYEDRIQAEKDAQELAEKQAEEQRIERARIQKENEQLKKDAEIREAKEKKEREEREKKQAVIQAEHDKKIKAEREKTRNLEAKIKAEKEEREKAEREIYEREQAKLDAGDDEKLESLQKDLEELSGRYSFESDRCKSIGSKVTILLNKINTYIDESK